MRLQRIPMRNRDRSCKRRILVAAVAELGSLAMRTFEKIALTLLILTVLTAFCTGVFASLREQKISQIRPGMLKRDVERLLGIGQPDTMSPACENCPTGRTQF